jgi:hypothetical protein
MPFDASWDVESLRTAALGPAIVNWLLVVTIVGTRRLLLCFDASFLLVAFFFAVRHFLRSPLSAYRQICQ